jgi:hypothetical protein
LELLEELRRLALQLRELLLGQETIVLQNTASLFLPDFINRLTDLSGFAGFDGTVGQSIFETALELLNAFVDLVYQWMTA